MALRGFRAMVVPNQVVFLTAVFALYLSEWRVEHTYCLN
jgi:hypothetical protein